MMPLYVHTTNFNSVFGIKIYALKPNLFRNLIKATKTFDKLHKRLKLTTLMVDITQKSQKINKLIRHVIDKDFAINFELTQNKFVQGHYDIVGSYCKNTMRNNRTKNYTVLKKCQTLCVKTKKLF